MSDLVSQNDLLLLLRLIVAHIVADFLFQKDSWVKERTKKKWSSTRLYLHGALAGIFAYVFSGLWNTISLPIVIFASHTLLDGLKSQAKDTVRSFLLDQLGHLLVIVGCWVLLVNVDISDVVTSLASGTSNVEFWILILSYTIVIWPAGVLIGKIMTPWRKAIKGASSQGLEKAGLWIGRLERTLIMTFVLLNQFEAIGFLIAAKSIFRFGEIRSPDQRKDAEYILIGTMVSFVIAIALGMVVDWVLHYPLILGE